jgi:hypothetical protein
MLEGRGAGGMLRSDPLGMRRAMEQSKMEKFILNWISSYHHRSAEIEPVDAAVSRDPRMPPTKLDATLFS